MPTTAATRPAATLTLERDIGDPHPATARRISRRRFRPVGRACPEKGSRRRARSKPAFGPNEALDGAGQHEQVGLPVRGMMLDDLLRRDPGPRVVEPGVPDVVGMFSTGAVDLEPRFHDVGGPQQYSDLGSSLRDGSGPSGQSACENAVT